MSTERRDSLVTRDYPLRGPVVRIEHEGQQDGSRERGRTTREMLRSVTSPRQGMWCSTMGIVSTHRQPAIPCHPVPALSHLDMRVVREAVGARADIAHARRPM